MPLPGSLFALEGPDGVGKTTLLERIYERLQRHGVDCIRAAFPGRETGTLGYLVHQLHHDPARYSVTALAPAALQMLHVAAHMDALTRVILPALRDGRVVLLDRFWWSTFVYGRESGIDAAAIRALLHVETHFWRGVVPSAVFLLTRSSSQSKHSLYARLAESYKTLAENYATEGHTVHVIDNNGDIDQAAASIEKVMLTALGLFPVDPPDAGKLHLPTSADGSRATRKRRTRTAPGAPTIAKSEPGITAPLGSLRPTPVFDTYWRFAAERQEIFFRRLKGGAPPWTTDPILQEYKFTNAYRACDRVSQFLIRTVIHGGDQSPDELFFRIILFKLFNRIDTWRFLEGEVGEIRWSDYRFNCYDGALSRAMEAGKRIYSAAYIMPSARVFGHERKHSNHLRLLELMMKDELPSRLRSAKSMEEAFLIIRKYPSIGDFLAYQYVTDLNYSDLTSFREDEFVVPGPGARDGIRKCFTDNGGFCDADLIKQVADMQEREFERLNISFKTLWGRRLQYIDCQNLFCEVDKYARVFHPDITGLSGRTRIKQKLNASSELIHYIFPKKWNLDERSSQVAQPDIIGQKQISFFEPRGEHASSI